MGNSRSRASVWTPDSQLDWTEYTTAEWRSERSIELDKLGGLLRPAIKRGNSMTEKLEYLQKSLNKQGQDMEAALAKTAHKSPEKHTEQRRKFLLRTDMRAMQRGHGSSQLPTELPPLTWAEQQALDKQAKMEARQRSLEYARSINRNSQRARHGPGGSSLRAGDHVDRAARTDVAAWRVNVHRARRRVMLVVLTVVRLRRGLNHPQRMQRVDSFSLFIPLVLGDECSRFADETNRCRGIVSDLLDSQREIEELERRPSCSGSSSMRSSATMLPPLQQQPQQLVQQHKGRHRSAAGEDPLAAAAAEAAAEARAADVDAAASLLLRAAAAPAPLPQMMSRRTASDFAATAAMMDVGGQEIEVPPGMVALRSLSARIDANVDAAAAASAPLAKGQGAPEALPPLMRKSSSPTKLRGIVPPHRQPAASEGGDELRTLHTMLARRSEGNACAPPQLGQQPQDVGMHPRGMPTASVRNPSLLLPRIDSEPTPPVPTVSGDVGLAALPKLLSRVLRVSGSGALPDICEDRASAPPELFGSGGGGGSPAAGRADDSQSHGADRDRASAGSTSLRPLPGSLARHASLTRQSSSKHSQGRGLGLDSGLMPHRHDSRRLRKSDSKAAARAAALALHIQEETPKLQRCEQMLGMYVNRANATWAECRKWQVPSPVSEAAQRTFQASDDFKVYRADVVRKLRAGHVVFQVFAAEDELQLAGGERMDLWTADPWELVAAARPGSMPLQGDRLEGLPVGGRALTQLRAAVHELAGQEAAGALPVVLHVNEAQLPAVLEDLQARHLYGLSRSSLFITVEQRRGGYTWDAAKSQFVAVRQPFQRLCSHGGGYAAMQMAWVGDAFTVGEDGALAALPCSLVEELRKRGAEWMVSRRGSDLALLSPGGALDVPELAHALRMRQRMRATMTVQAMQTDGHSVWMRQMDSVMVGCVDGGSTAGASGLGVPAMADGVSPVVELRTCEVASTGMVEVLKRLRGSGGNRTLVGLHRYALHLPSLVDQLRDVHVFRPKLLLDGTTVHVSLEQSDLTAAPGARCIAMARGATPRMLLSATEVEDLVPLLLDQDHDMRFRGVAGMASSSVASALKRHNGSAGGASVTGAAGPTPPRTPPRPSGQRIVVFCADNTVTATAVELVKLIARPGRDEVCLVTVVPTSLQQEQGQQLVMRFGRQLSRAMIHATMDVVVKGYLGLLECLDEYVRSRDAGLAVMGSAAITTNTTVGGSSSVAAAVGSVAVACAKRLRLPLAVVTANTRLLRSPAESSRLARRAAQHAAAAGGPAADHAVTRIDHNAPRVLAVVEKQSQAMLKYLVGSCLDPLRGDQLILGQVFQTRMLTSQQQTTSKRLMETFGDIAARNHVPPIKMQLDGSFDRALAQSTEAEGVQLLALQLKPEEKGLPGEVLSLMRSSRAAVLLYRDGVSHG